MNSVKLITSNFEVSIIQIPTIYNQKDLRCLTCCHQRFLKTLITTDMCVIQSQIQTWLAACVLLDPFPFDTV